MGVVRVALALAFIAACDSAERPRDPLRAQGAPVDASAAPMRAEDASDADAAAALPTSVDAGARVAVTLGNTPGRVACGSGACRLPAEKCCDEACVPAAASCAGTPRSCDDATDCAGGRVCCVNRDRSRMGKVVECGRAPCEVDESCAPGGTCSRGLVCTYDDAAAGRAFCVPAHPRARCGRSTCPEGIVCCTVGDGGPWCVSDASRYCNMLSSGLRCTTPSDCAPYRCCDYKGIATYCQDGCASVFERPICRTIADCPPRLTDEGAIVRARACEHERSEMLPGVDVCVYP